MTFADGSRLMNSAMLVMRMLGWAWRWAEMWVLYGSNWEPLLEPGQKESNMSKAQLKIVDSTPESRCEDARRCRLTAFGAALRNRLYDKEDGGFLSTELDKALRAILHTKSLVGPLEQVEIDFFAVWLARAYRSKSKFLGMGTFKIPVASEWLCVNRQDKSPKFELQDRPLPGRATDKDEVFEPPVNEPDDFLKPEVTEDGEPLVLTPKDIEFLKKKKESHKKSTTSKKQVKKPPTKPSRPVAVLHQRRRK